jgi:hypothetical protein
MTRKMSFLMPFCVAWFIFISSSSSQAQRQFRPRPERCKVDSPEPDAPEYRVGRALRHGENLSQMFLVISVEPENFTKDKMIALTRQIKKDYCHETKFMVIFFDDYEAARRVLFLDVTKRLEVARRGFYRFDSKKEEYIRFSTARGRPLDEVKIDLWRND